MKRQILVLLFIFLFSFFIRFIRLSDNAIYPDEITWMVRAKETALAVRTGNLDYFESAWWNIKNDTEAISLPLTFFAGFPLIYLANDASVLSFNLAPDYMVARTVVIIFSSIFIASFYLVVSKIFDKKSAFFSSIFLSLDPAFLYSSKVVMNDIFLTAFVFLSFSSYFLIKNRRQSFIFSSLFFALAFISKPSALFLLPVYGVNILLTKKKIKPEFSKFLAFLGLSLVFIIVFWPAGWKNPIFAIPEYIFRQTNLTQAGINNYFFGKITENPPFYYYLVQLLIRVPLIAIAAFVAFYYKFRKKLTIFDKNVLVFVFTFIFLMSLSSKKLGIRYILPALPFIYLYFVKTLFVISQKMKIGIFFILIPLFIYSYNFVSFFSNHDLYYNPLIGGLKNARKIDLVGLCRGSKEGVDFILSNYSGTGQIGVVGCGNSTVPYYYPYSYSPNWKDKKIFVVESYYLQLQKDPELLEFIKNKNPAKTIYVNGLELSRIYKI